ncbi:MAG: cytochrome c [Woeseiaceae bacterium]|nr:cytochrome c [Woeseiaceae bacterium]
MRRSIRISAALVAVLLIASWWLTSPQTLANGDLPDYEPDAVAGERIFWAGGCASCHATPVDGKRARGDAKLRLGGGTEFETEYGVFRVPNISTHEQDGIGGWSVLEFVNAMQRGVSPQGRHYYPSFPYTSYAKMRTEDVMDLKAYIDTLPAVEGRPDGHELGFPWNVRRGIGAWKRLYLDDSVVVDLGTDDPEVLLGQYLVEGAGHCAECHTPRDGFGGLLAERWLGGAPAAEGTGSVPNITPAAKTLSGWSAGDISYYLESGFTPDFDSVGGTMVAVQENMARLTKADRDAIAAYLKSIPPVE